MTAPPRPSQGLDEVRVPRVPGLTVKRVLGRGGMGAVFLAFEEATGRRVALKVIAGKQPAADARARFATEIDALSRVRHPNVVALRAAGEVDGVPYAVLDYVGGFGLDRVAGPLAWTVAAHLGLQLASAVTAVHAAGYLHRDIKPSNVMVTRKGLLTLIDFGLAKPARGPRALAGRDMHRSGSLTVPWTAGPELTAAGTCVGTPRFLAPEVSRGERATEQSDVFSLGIVLGRLLGLPAANDRDDLPDALADLVVRCLAPAPHTRPDAAEVVAVLEGLVSRPARVRRATTTGDADRDDDATWIDTSPACAAAPLAAGTAA